MANRADPDTLARTHQAFHATDAAWSAELARHYGKPGSIAYDHGRYRTTYAAWPGLVQAAWCRRALAYAAWCKARDLGPAAVSSDEKSRI
jgi:hypothetical protein